MWKQHQEGNFNLKSQWFWHLICQNWSSIDNSMAPQRRKVLISIIAVNRIDHTDWLDIMVDDLNHLSPHVLIFLFYSFDFPMYKNEQMVIVTLHLHTSITQFGSILSWICILASSIPIGQHRWFTVHFTNFTKLKEQELFFIWHLYEEANVFKLHICWYKNNHLFISANW